MVDNNINDNSQLNQEKNDAISTELLYRAKIIINNRISSSLKFLLYASIFLNIKRLHT